LRGGAVDASGISLEEYQMALIAAADEIAVLKAALESNTQQVVWRALCWFS
jgi:hypothetical protein